jgi:hypothetical protein
MESKIKTNVTDIRVALIISLVFFNPVIPEIQNNVSICSGNTLIKQDLPKIKFLCETPCLLHETPCNKKIVATQMNFRVAAENN